MTREEIISGLQMTMDLILFDPATGETLTPDMLNDTNRVTYDACKGAIEALKAQDVPDTNVEDTISRQATIDRIDAIAPRKTDSDYQKGIAVGMAMAKVAIIEQESAQPKMVCVANVTLTDEQVQEAFEKAKRGILSVQPKQPEIIRCKDCKFYTPMNRETKTGICRLLMHQNFGDDWYCAGAERRTDG